MVSALASNTIFYFSVKNFTSESALEDEYRKETVDEIWAGVVFKGDFTNGWPKDIIYKLRVTKGGSGEDSAWHTDLAYPYFQTFGFRNNDTTGDKPGTIE